MSRDSTLEERFGASESTLSSSTTRIGELDSQLASKNSEFDETVVQ